MGSRMVTRGRLTQVLRWNHMCSMIFQSRREELMLRRKCWGSSKPTSILDAISKTSSTLKELAHQWSLQILRANPISLTTLRQLLHMVVCKASTKVMYRWRCQILNKTSHRCRWWLVAKSNSRTNVLLKPLIQPCYDNKRLIWRNQTSSSGGTSLIISRQLRIWESMRSPRRISDKSKIRCQQRRLRWDQLSSGCLTYRTCEQNSRATRYISVMWRVLTS